MRCKKHPADVSSSVGVCASCLRGRLFAVIAAQAHAQALKQAQAHTQQARRKSDTDPPPRPPISFPRSVSPYISGRKSDTTAAATWRPQRFFSTPQVGPSSGSIGVEVERVRNGKVGRLSSLFYGLFRSKSDKPGSGPGPTHDPVKPCSVSTPSWFHTNFIASRRKKKRGAFSIDEIKGGGAQPRRIVKDRRDRGMSPARYSDDEDHAGWSEYSSESSHGWKQTPRRTPASVRPGGGKAAAQSKNVSGLTFCLSPLVRASPGHRWNQKGLPSELVVAGEFRVPGKPCLSAAAAFCKNRSRKLADFGKYN